MRDRVMIADLKKFAVWIYVCMKGGIEGWDEVETYAATPEEAWRKVYRRWGAETVPDLKKVREIK